jgi:hypothetical protein
MLFSIIVDCDEKGKLAIWAQQKENLSPENQEKLTNLMLSFKKIIRQQPIENKIEFDVPFKNK